MANSVTSQLSAAVRPSERMRSMAGSAWLPRSNDGVYNMSGKHDNRPCSTTPNIHFLYFCCTNVSWAIESEVADQSLSRITVTITCNSRNQRLPLKYTNLKYAEIRNIVRLRPNEHTILVIYQFPAIMYFAHGFKRSKIVVINESDFADSLHVCKFLDIISFLQLSQFLVS